MCQSNTSETLCGRPVQLYAIRQPGVKKPRVTFCSRISATILHSLLSVVPPVDYQQDPELPPFAKILKQIDAFIDLCQKCNIWHSGKIYKQLIIPAFRAHIGWVQGVVKKAGGLTFSNNLWTPKWCTNNIDAALEIWTTTLGQGSSSGAQSVVSTAFTNQEAISAALEINNPPVPRPAPLQIRKAPEYLPDLADPSIGDGRTRNSPGLTQDLLSESHRAKGSAPPRHVSHWASENASGPRDTKETLLERLDQLAKQQHDHLESASALAYEQAALWQKL